MTQVARRLRIAARAGELIALVRRTARGAPLAGVSLTGWTSPRTNVAVSSPRKRVVFKKRDAQLATAQLVAKGFDVEALAFHEAVTDRALVERLSIHGCHIERRDDGQSTPDVELVRDTAGRGVADADDTYDLVARPHVIGDVPHHAPGHASIDGARVGARTRRADQPSSRSFTSSAAALIMSFSAADFTASAPATPSTSSRI